MSRREDIDNAIWSDPDFEALSLEAAMLYIWSWTNPRCGLAGLYKVSERAMTESKVTLERLPDVLAELAAADFLFYESGVLFVRSRLKHFRTKTPQVAKSVASDVVKLSEAHPMRAMWIDEYVDTPWWQRMIFEGHVTLDRPSPEGHQNGSSKHDSVTLTRGSGDPHPRVLSTGTGKEGGPGETNDAPPADFPDDLRCVLPQVVMVLERVASAKKANAVTVAATARAMASYPRRPHLKAAEGMEHWLVYGTGATRRVKDVVGTYRNQLDSNWQDQARTVAATGAGADDLDARLAAAEQRRAERAAREDARA